MARYEVTVDPSYAGIPNNFVIEADSYVIEGGVLNLWRAAPREMVASFRIWNSVEKIIGS